MTKPTCPITIGAISTFFLGGLNCFFKFQYNIKIIYNIIMIKRFGGLSPPTPPQIALMR